MMAMGVLNAANQHGLTVPHDFSLIGYDDIHIAQFMSPALTTIHQPKYRLGQAAVETLLKRLANEDTKEALVEFEPTLVERHTVAQI